MKTSALILASAVLAAVGAGRALACGPGEYVPAGAEICVPCLAPNVLTGDEYNGYSCEPSQKYGTPPTCSASASPSHPAKGETVTVSWTSQNNRDVMISIPRTQENTGVLPVSGSKTFDLDVEGTVTFEVHLADGNGGTGSCSTSVTIGPRAPDPLGEMSGDTEDKTRKEIRKGGERSTGAQLPSPEEQRQLVTIGADHKASEAAAYCALFANQLASKKAYDEALARCLRGFETANGLAPGRGAKGFGLDRNVADHEATRVVLEDFEKNFGVAPEEYWKRMLGAGGDVRELREMLKDKIPEERVGAALDGARSQAPKSAGRETLTVPAARATAASMARDALRRKLAEAIERRPASERAGEKRGAAPDHLEALQAAEAFGTGKDTDGRELSLFDVVRRKYREIAPRMSRGTLR